MKNTLMALLLLAGFGATAQTKRESSVNDLVGTWRNRSGAGLDIVDSATVYLVRGDKRKLATASFSNRRSNLISFNLVVKDSAKLVTVKGLLMLLNDDVLQWQVFDADSKPASYAGGNGDLIFLKRINTLMN